MDGTACRFEILLLSIALKLQECLQNGDIGLELKCGVALEHHNSIAHAHFRHTTNLSSGRRSAWPYC